MQPGGAFEVADDRLGELQRKRLGFAPGEIDENVGDILLLGGEVETRDRVGLVLGLGKACGAGIRRALRERVDRRPLGIALPPSQRIGVN